ncbi:hypothetical protein D3C72_2458710 [compost metagenome]
MRATNGLGTRFGKTKMFDLTFRDQILHRSGNIFNGHIGIDAVLIQQIDHVGFKPTQ